MSQIPSFSTWYSTLVNFRKNPSAYLSGKKLSGSNFVLDVLQELCQENVHADIKTHLLILLQEYSVLLFAESHESIETTVGTLQTLYQQTCRHSGLETFHGQILITITTILLSCDQLEHQPTLFCGFVDILLDVVSKVNQVGQSTRAMACLCLEEIESLYPGILSHKLDHFYQMCQLEMTFSCQNYMTLLVTCLRNAVRKLQSGQSGVDDRSLTDLLCNRKEPLKPLILPQDLHSLKLHMKFHSTPAKQLPGNVDTRELKRAVSFLMDHTQTLTGASHFQMLCQLVDVVKMTPQFSSSIFKPHLLRFLSTLDLPLFYLVFYLRLHFGSDLFSGTERDTLLKHLLVSIHHPALSIPHRLMLFDWLLHFPQDSGEVPPEACVPSELDYTQYAAFFPTVFDSAEIKLIKLSILSMCFTPGEQPDSVTATLMGCLVCLHKPVHYGVTGKTAVVLFRVLYQFYVRHEQTALAKDLERFILGVVLEQPKFVPYILDFIQCVRKYKPSSLLPVEVLESLTKQVISTPVEQVLEKLNFYLMILDRAAHEVQIKPKATIMFLQQLVDGTSFCADGGWSLGNRLLAVCRSILQFHDTDPVYIELGDLLHSLFTHHKEVDVRDRAKFLYSLLVNVSSEKLSTILLRSPLTAKATTQTLTNLVASSGNFPTAAPIIHVEYPVMQLTRMEETVTHDVQHANATPSVESGIIHTYWRHIHSSEFTPGMKKKYYVHFANNRDPTFQRIHAVNLTVTANSSYRKMTDVYLPVLDRETSSAPGPGCISIVLHFQPQEPVAGTFQTNAIFTCQDGSTYSCDLVPVTLTFNDLFQPFPSPPTNHGRLFEELWEHIESKSRQNDSDSVLSICRLLLNKAQMEKISGSKLGPFLIESSEQDYLRLGIFLPPRYSLLLKVIFPADDNTFSLVNVATDNWKILPDVQNFLKSLEEITII
ncbi:AP-5 complex subunit beta-1-like [Lineus longissimus]|uniref:AP-5 complex subunit beta-1-like n=1 Tax=Lineus longissimus TaxID=88925 RepID=UPI00315D16B3